MELLRQMEKALEENYSMDAACRRAMEHEGMSCDPYDGYGTADIWD